jgi:hypothetical protein
MTKNSVQRDRAEARFTATTHARRTDQSRAKLEHEEQAQAGYEKTAKLKSLRLAREAAEKAVAPAGKAPSRKRGAARKATAGG